MSLRVLTEQTAFSILSLFVIYDCFVFFCCCRLFCFGLFFLVFGSCAAADLLHGAVFVYPIGSLCVFVLAVWLCAPLIVSEEVFFHVFACCLTAAASA